jgi:hypothetical protein
MTMANEVWKYERSFSAERVCTVSLLTGYIRFAPTAVKLLRIEPHFEICFLSLGSRCYIDQCPWSSLIIFAAFSAMP